MSKWLDAATAAGPHLFPDIETAVPRAVSAVCAVRQKTAIFCVPIASATNNPENSFCAKIPDLPVPETPTMAENCLTALLALLATGTELSKPGNVVCLFCGRAVQLDGYSSV